MVGRETYNQRQIKEARFTCSPWGKVLEKQTEKQVDAITSLGFFFCFFRNYWSSISPLQYCQQRLWKRFKSLVCIYS